MAFIEAPDARGTWRRTDTALGAILLRGEQRIPLTAGLAVEPGDRVVTDEARVEVELPGGERLMVAPHSDVELRPRSTLQRLGEVYYSVRDVFTVQYGTVQTSVEGTEFTVGGAGDVVTVTVVEGRVRVAAPGGEVRVSGGQVATAGTTVTVAAPVGAGLQAVYRTSPSGAPTAELGGFVAGGLAVGSSLSGAAPAGGTSIRATGLLRVAPGLRLAVDAGLASNGASGLRLPVALGLEAGSGAVTGGLQAAGTLELDRLGCTGEYAALHLGGLAYGRYTHALSHRLFAAAVVRAGWVQGPVADGSVGLLVPL